MRGGSSFIVSYSRTKALCPSQDRSPTAPNSPSPARLLCPRMPNQREGDIHSYQDEQCDCSSTQHRAASTSHTCYHWEYNIGTSRSSLPLITLIAHPPSQSHPESDLAPHPTSRSPTLLINDPKPQPTPKWRQTPPTTPPGPRRRGS